MTNIAQLLLSGSPAVATALAACPCQYSPFHRLIGYTDFVAKWVTVTVTDGQGRRHSLDLLAESSYDAAHLFFCEAHADKTRMLPLPDRRTIFEVVTNGRVYTVRGERLRAWIEERRSKSSGPRGYLFKQRPVLE